MKKFLFLCALLAQFILVGSTTPNSKIITLYIHGTKVLPGVNYFMQGYFPAGLHQAESLCESYHPLSLISTLSTGKVPLCNRKDLYLYGWNGNLWPSSRLNAAKDCKKAILEQLITKEHSPENPLILRLLTHSHGGAVGLYLAGIIEEENLPIEIKELILMGCPMQERTEALAACKCIKKIYNLYSEQDIIQIIDPQGIYPDVCNTQGLPLFSYRILNFSQKNMWNIGIKLNNKSLGHSDFIHTTFLRYIQQIINKAQKHEHGHITINVIDPEKIYIPNYTIQGQ